MAGGVSTRRLLLQVRDGLPRRQPDGLALEAQGRHLVRHGRGHLAGHILEGSGGSSRRGGGGGGEGEDAGGSHRSPQQRRDGYSCIFEDIFIYFLK